MGINILQNYLSRSQIRDYLGYILENGVDGVIESPDNVYATDPIPDRLGSSINSIKIYHVSRHLAEDAWLTQEGLILSSDDTKPEIISENSIIGIFYMSRHGKDYKGEKDSICGTDVQGDIGSVVWVDSKDWDSVSLGATTEGINYRLFVFWRADIGSSSVE